MIWLPDVLFFFFFNDTATTEIYTLSLHDALPIAVTTRMVQFLRRSPVFRQLMCDLFSGTQDYTSLKRRLWGHLGITVSEFISSVLNLDRPAKAIVPRAGTAGD